MAERTKARKRSQMVYPRLQFSAVWNTSDSVDEVVRRTGMEKGAVLARACKLRSKGIDLKKMPRVPSTRINVEECNALLRRLKEMEREGKNLKSLTPDELVHLASQDEASGSDLINEVLATV